MKIIFHEFFWTTFLSVGVQRNADRKEKIFFGESSFSLEFVFLKNFWLVWYGSSMGVHTNDDKIKKNSLKKKPTLSVFSKVSFEYHCYQWEYRVPLLNKEKQFSK